MQRESCHPKNPCQRCITPNDTPCLTTGLLPDEMEIKKRTYEMDLDVRIDAYKTALIDIAKFAKCTSIVAQPEWDFDLNWEKRCGKCSGCKWERCPKEFLENVDSDVVCTPCRLYHTNIYLDEIIGRDGKKEKPKISGCTRKCCLRVKAVYPSYEKDKTTTVWP
jgi:hypothetical protein